jgi:hypothetical protein
MKISIYYSILAIAGTVLSGLGGSASLASDFHSPRIAALGGAGHAGPLLNDAILLNPSYASFLPTYSGSANLSVFKGPDTATPEGRFHGRHYNVSVQDGNNELFQAGASYTLREDCAIVHLGASHTVIKQLGIGLGGKYYYHLPGGGSGKDMVFSTTGALDREIQASFIVDNLMEEEAGKKIGLYREFILGTKYNAMNIVMVYLDPHYAPNVKGASRYGYEAGVEFPFYTDLFVRAGMFRSSMVPIEGERGRGFGMGIGWIAPRLSLDYALQRVLTPRLAVAHVFGFTAFF